MRQAAVTMEEVIGACLGEKSIGRLRVYTVCVSGETQGAVRSHLWIAVAGAISVPITARIWLATAWSSLPALSQVLSLAAVLCWRCRCRWCRCRSLWTWHGKKLVGVYTT